MNRILIVDDKEENLLYLEALLTGPGGTVESARHGAEALVKARQNVPDVVISDLLMPVMDGYTLLRHWKADARLKHVPFIVYTATYTEPEDEQLALGLGADAFILKPSEPEHLVARLREVQANAASANPAPPRLAVDPEADLLELYNATLIRKLEEKTIKLDESHRALRKDVVKCENAELAHRRMVDHQMAILNALPAHIALVDAAGVIISVNDAWRHFATANVLQRPDFCVGQNYLAVCEQATGDCSAEAHGAAAGIRRVLAGEAKDFSIEYPSNSPLELRWFRMMVTPLRENERAGAVIMHVNITARKISENSVRESEQRLTFALTAAHIGDWSLNLRTNVAHRSLRHDECFGYHTMLPKWDYDTFLAHVDPADREHVDACFQKAMAGLGEIDHEFRTTWPDGSVHWLWARGRCYCDDAGKPSRMAGIVADITERKESEKVMKKTLERLTEAQRIGQIGDWEWDIATQAITWSPQVFEIVGRDPRLGPPRNYEEQKALYDETSQALMQEKVALAVSSGQSQDYDLVVIRPGGERVHVHAMAVPSQDESCRVSGLHGTIQNITARKQAETSLKESEQRLELATASAHIGIWDWDVVKNKMVWDQQMYAHYGISVAAFSDAYDAWQKGLHPDDRERAEVEIKAALAGSIGLNSEFRIRRPDGQVRHLEAHGLVRRAEDGSPTRMIGVNWDITERKSNEERIREQAALIDAASDAIIVRDLEYRITFWSQGAQRIYGWTSPEAKGRLFPELLQADLEIFSRADRAIREAGEWKGEIQKRTSKGELLTLDCRWTLMWDDLGTARSILSIDTDITDRKKLEQQFLRAQRMESIGTLAGGIAHDLNNVFAPILMSVDLLAMSCPDPESKGMLSILRTSAQHGAEMVRQVLSFARGVEGRRMEVQVAHLVIDIQKIVHDTFLKNIQIQTNVPRNLWTLIGDPTQLHQVLLNLCVNARDAMPNGGSLIITAENRTLDEQYVAQNPEATAGPHVFLQVEDTGTGIPREIIEKIFDPFFTTKGVGKGTGLGLSTSLAIIKSHGGFLRVYSEPDRGSKFQFYLPALSGASPETSARKENEMPRGKGEMILVVDDEASLRQITQQTLLAFGYRVLLACDGADAIAIFARQGADIAAVLTDMTMPVMDGPATIQVLLKMNPMMPIIAASGLSASPQIAKATSLGVKHFLSKPYTADTLLKKLREALAVEK